MSARDGTKLQVRRVPVQPTAPSARAASDEPRNAMRPGLSSKPLVLAPRPAWRSVVLLTLAGVAAAVLVGWQLFRVGTPARGVGPTAAAPGNLPGVPLQDFVAAPGLVEAESGTLHLAFEKGGKIRAVHVAEGQQVKAGQLVAALVNDEETARLAFAFAELKVSEADDHALVSELKAEEIRASREVDRHLAEMELAKAGPRKEEIERARALVKAAEAEYERRKEDAKRYLDPTISSAQARDLAGGQAQITAAQLAAERAKLKELEAGTRVEEINKIRAIHAAAQANLECAVQTREMRLAASQGRIKQAQARVSLAEAELKRTQLVSPIDGVVIWKFHHAGESVGALPLEPVIGVADPTRLRVRADLDESDYARVKPGQKVLVTCEAYRGQYFPGQVAFVSHSAGQKRFNTGNPRERMDVKVVECVIILENPSPFKLGLPVTAYIDSDALPSAKR